MVDPIGTAMAATDPPATVPTYRATVTLPSTGRNVALAVPADISTGELIEFVAFLTTQLGPMIAEQFSRRASPIIVPDGRIAVPIPIRKT